MTLHLLRVLAEIAASSGTAYTFFTPKYSLKTASIKQVSFLVYLGKVYAYEFFYLCGGSADFAFTCQVKEISMKKEGQIFFFAPFGRRYRALFF